MNRILSQIVLFMALGVLAACAPTGGEASLPAPATTSPPASEPTASLVEDKVAGPDEVTRAFYDWYLTYIGEPGSADFRNPLVDGAYRDNESLSPAFVASIDETLASFDQGGYDPILLAQDVPERIEVGAAAIDGDQAAVPVLRYWGGNPDPSPMIVNLALIEGRWLIDSVAQEAAQSNPAAVVEAFYRWYLAYIGEPGSEAFRNPLVDRAYHDSPLLTDSLKAHLDDKLDQDVAEYGGIVADPILCAQNIPGYVMAETFRANGEQASVVVRTSFSRHMISLDLRQEDDEWLISNITCPGTPEGMAAIFYNWYLSYIGDPAGEFHNPLVDRAYRDHQLLTESLVQEIDGLLDEGINYDPFLLAQDVPSTFSVDPGPEPGTAVVHLQFGPDSVRHILVTVDGMGIAAIAEAQPPGEGSAQQPPSSETLFEPPADWVTQVESSLGVGFSYPADWMLRPMALNETGMPDDWPVVAGWLLMPPEVAEALDARSGPPDPNASPLVAPFQIEVISGAGQLQRVVPVIEGAVATFGANQVTFVTMDPGYNLYIFAHPSRADLWLVVTDWITGFPGREEQAVAAGPVVAPLLRSVSFFE